MNEVKRECVLDLGLERTRMGKIAGEGGSLENYLVSMGDCAPEFDYSLSLKGGYDLSQISDERLRELFGEDTEDTEFLVGGIASFLEMPMIWDKFDKHEDRREWRIALNDNFGKEPVKEILDKRNRLRGNRIMSNFLYPSQMLLDRLQEKGGFEEVNRKIQESFNLYNKLNPLIEDLGLTREGLPESIDYNHLNEHFNLEEVRQVKIRLMEFYQETALQFLERVKGEQKLEG